MDPVILAFLLPTTLKRYCIKIFAARYFRKLARLAKLRARKKTGFTVADRQTLGGGKTVALYVDFDSVY